MSKFYKKKMAFILALSSIFSSRVSAMDRSRELAVFRPESKIESQSDSKLVESLKMAVPTLALSVIFVVCAYKIGNYVKNKSNIDLSNVDQNTGEINLNAVKNIRFLGWKMKDENGNLINDKAFIRSGNTSELTPEDLTVLKKLGVKTVIDLRYPEETKYQSDKFSVEPGVNYKNITIPVNYAFFNNSEEMIVDYLRALGLVEPQTVNKKNNKERERKNIKEIFETIAEAPEDGKILFHCSYGKDRTGILSMLLLGLAGVSKEDIVTNFIDCYNKNGKSQVQSFTRQAVERFIDVLIKKYSSIESFLRNKCELSDETIQKVKKRINPN